MSVELQLTYVTGPDGKRALTIPDEQRANAIAFVRENALRPAAEIEAIVQEGHASVLHAVANVSEEQAAWKPSADDWSILEVMDHIVSVNRLMGMVSNGLAKGALPPGLSGNVESASAQDGVSIVKFKSLAEARAAVDAAHAELVAFILSLDARPEPTLTFSHFVFGAFNFREWPVFQRVHDDNHAPQIEAVKQSAGFPT